MSKFDRGELCRHLHSQKILRSRQAMQYVVLMRMRQKKALQSIVQSATRLRMGVKYWRRSKPASSRAAPKNNFRTSHQERHKRPLLFRWHFNVIKRPLSRLHHSGRRNTHTDPKTSLKRIFGRFLPMRDFCIEGTTTTENRDLPQNYHSADTRKTRKARKTRFCEKEQVEAF